MSSTAAPCCASLSLSISLFTAWGRSGYCACLHPAHSATEAHIARGDGGHYNEFEIDGSTLDANLPWSIEAFMSGNIDMTAIHAAFLEKYGITAAEVPLLTMTPNPARLFIEGAVFQSEGDPTRPCDPETDHKSCGL